MDSPLLNPIQTLEHRGIITDIISQAITGELIGMSNFASLAGAIDDVHEKMEAVEHANCERKHAEGFIALSKKFGLDPIINLEGYYWKNVRECFLKYAAKGDFIGCIIIQEVMLECFAVSMYHDVGQALDNEIGALFTAISQEEEEHIEHSIELLQAELTKDSEAFYSKMENIHKDCMTILAEWTAKTDLKGHCGVCKGSCMKEAMPEIALDVTRMRGNALNLYLSTLDRIGLPNEKTLRWVINLPA
ncbi:long-chain fatty aldehyde decarbonylase [Pontibacter toksunensis]|uniref:Long-chain fatty aldehyde decarbonylase n=1 Tax=Pontibacter toksunensis TaxID=1332631 RepID=A0ABW6BZN2_9BACT